LVNANADGIITFKPLNSKST